MAYTPSLVVTGFYFDTKINLANTLIGFGASLSTLSAPFIVQEMVHFYGWRGSLMIMAAISLNVCVCGLIMKPNKVSRESQAGGKVFDLKLFLNWKLVLLLVHEILLGFGMSVVYMHLPAFSVKQGASHLEASVLISIIGTGGLVGKLITGLTAHSPKVSPVTVCVISYSVCGIATCALPFCGNSYYFLPYLV